MTVADPLVSVLTPSFNQSRWLVDNLRSVACQTYPNIEHIVIDGGSTDGSIEILAAAGDRVRWRSEDDRGQAHALNKALAESRGEIIGWLNSDDAYYHVDAVSSAVAAFRQDPGVDVVYGHAALVNAQGLILQMMWVPRFNESLLRRHNFIVQPTAFIRRTVLDEGLVDETYQNIIDRELWLRLASRGHTFSRVNEVVAIDRHQLLRKTLLQRPVELRESEWLAEQYAVPSLTRRPYRLQLKLLKIAFRFIGISLIARRSSDFAFAAQVDTRFRLLTRQVATTRAAMPDGMEQVRSAR